MPQVTLTADVLHAGRQHAAGEKITCTEDVAENLIRKGLAEKLKAPAKRSAAKKD